MRSIITVEKLNNIWNNLFSAFENEVEESFKDTKKKIYASVIESISMDKRVTEFDEQIFSYYEKLIGYYKKSMAVYSVHKKEITTPKISQMLDGLESVMKSRISQFEEICSYSNDFANPVYTEKKKILESAQKDFFRQADEIKGEFLNDFKNVCDIKTMTFSEINNFFNENYIDKVYSVYQNAVKKIISMLNDIDNRKILSTYFEILKEEKELLSGVIKVQAEALEDCEQTDIETDIIQNILLYLREGYQHITKNVDTIINVFSNTDSIKKDIYFVPKEVFVKPKESDDAIFGARIEEIFHKKDVFVQSLNEFVINLAYDRIKREIKRTDEVKLSAQNDILIADSFVSIFSDMTKYLDENEQVKGTIFKKIIEGIDETIRIKTESIAENTRLLNERLNEYVENNADIDVEFTAEQEKEVVDSAFTAWVESGGFSEENIDEMFLTGSTMPEIIKRYERLRRFIQGEVLKFKREQLLFELTTFEEIINYSVERLRNSENEDVEGYVGNIDENTGKIKAVLDENNIDVIHPMPHEKFNAKLHEVVVAEKSRDFAKGEIIRTLTSGYVQGDTVIIRANVVAAK